MNRLGYLIAGTLALLVLAALGALHHAARSVEDSIRQALGPQGEAAEINVRLTSIELLDVRIAAPKGWPSESTLRAKRILVTPDVRHLISEHMQISRLHIEGAYLSALRPKEGGGLRVMPGFAERARQNKREDDERGGATIDVVELNDCVVEVFDATVVGKPQKVRLQAVEGTVRDIRVPELTSRTRADLQGIVEGPNRSGSIAVEGWVEVAQKNAVLTTRVRNVDLTLFEPYLISKPKSGIDAGRLDLELKSSVRKNVVDAEGTLTVSALKLTPSETPLDALADLPRRVAIGALEDNQERITVPFTLNGNLDDPAFSLTGDSALETGIAVAKAFGMSFEGIARAFLIIVNGLGSAFGALVPG